MERISFNGFKNEYATFKTAESVQVGKAAGIDEDGKIIAGIDGDYIIGFICNQRSGLATVQLQGYIETKYTGDDIACGALKLVYNETGGVRLPESGEEGTLVKVVKADSDSKTVGFIF